MVAFPCTRCGACCVNVAAHASHLDRGDGMCQHFDERSRLCTIYDTRPLACRIDACYENSQTDKMSQRAYQRLTAMACNELQDRQGLAQKYRIDVRLI